ncbi:MAG TPA: lipid II flippase MurJ, partial [Candidatus Deferrimicrobiaceae bacterium]
EWTTRVFGSFLLAGAISWLNNARRLMQVPVGIFGQASGVASYPFLSALAAEGRKEKMWDTLSLTLRWVFLVSAGVAAMAFVLSREAVLLVYQRGAFTIDDTLRTAEALSAFCIGIPFWCAQAIVARGFFAMRDTWTPTLAGTAAWVVALPAYYLLQQSLGVFGLALASTAGILLYAGALYGILMRRTVGRRGVADLPEYGKMAAAAVLAGAAGHYALLAASRFLPWETPWGAIVRFIGGAAAVGAAYFFLGLLFSSRTVRTIKGRRDLLHPPGSGEPPPDGDGDGSATPA